MNRVAYGVHRNDHVMFLTLDAAEAYLIDQYPEYCGSKDSTYDFCENMIWENKIIQCEECNKPILEDDAEKVRQCHEHCCYIFVCSEGCR